MIKIIKQYGISTFLLLVAIFCLFNISFNVTDTFTVVTNSLALFLAIVYFVNFEKDIIIKIKSFVLNIKWPFHGKTKKILTNVLNFIIEKRWDIISYLFLFLLLIIALGQFSYLEKFIDLAWINKYQVIITVLAILSGGLTFWHNRERVEKEIEKEQINEQRGMDNRKAEFSKINALLDKIKLKLPNNHKLGVLFLMLFIVALGLTLRVWNLSYLQGSDNFNLISAKSLYDSGSFAYSRNIDITYTIFILFKIFGLSLVAARIPFILIGTISIVMIYLLGKFFNKKIALLSSFMLAINPMAIETSSFMREYSMIMFINLLSFLWLLKLYEKYKKNIKLFFFHYLSTFTVLSLIIYIYSFVANTGTIKAIILTLVIESIIIFYYFIRLNYKIYIKHYLVFLILFSLLFINTLPIFANIFSSNISFNSYWLRMFFDPLVNSPMQWFSFSKISPFLIFFLFSLGFFVSYKKDLFKITYLTFLITIFLFLFLFNWQYQHDRYLYHIFPLYITIFSVSLYYFYKLVMNVYVHNFQRLIVILFIFSSVILPSNTLHGAKHDLTLWGAITDYEGRSPSKSGNRNYFFEIFRYLESIGFSRNDAIIIRGESPTFITWHFNYPATRRYYNDYYETGDKVFSIQTSLDVDELSLATSEYNTGYFLTPSSGTYKNQNFIINNTFFVYNKTIEGYNIYKWESIILND